MCTPADDCWSCEGAQTSYATEKKTEKNDCREHASTFLGAKVLLVPVRRAERRQLIDLSDFEPKDGKEQNMFLSGR
jgi:hypothetical protein